MSNPEFALRFPFRPMHWVDGVEESIQFRKDEMEVSLSASPPYLVLRAQPFDSEEAAISFLPRLWGAVAWMAVRVGTGFIAEMEIDSVAYTDDPERAAENLNKSMGLPNRGPVHGIVNGNFPSVLPLGKNIRFITAGDVSVSQTLSRGLVEGPLNEGLQAPGASELYGDERLRTAIELFCDSHRESSVRSKFLTLAMAIEVLTQPAAKHVVAQELLDTLQELVTRGLAAHAVDSEEWHALDSLQRELLFRRDNSIRSRVRTLVSTALSKVPDAERSQLARDAVWVYDLRGALVHDGTVPKNELSRGYGLARSVIMQLLTARMQLVGTHGNVGA
jgi:Apea-like HEPN